MNPRSSAIARLVACVLAFAGVAGAQPAFAQESIYAIKGVMGTASEAALNKLAEPGAFSSDDTIRITLLSRSRPIGEVTKADQKNIAATDFDSRLNRAAELAVTQAKPAFRSAIDRLTRKDAGRMTTGGSTAATQYLKKVAGDEILASMTPLVRDALAKYALFKSAADMSAIGMTPDRLTSYVAQRTCDAIFFYMGQEERQSRVRAPTTPILTGPRF
jgi:hypothetical protein